MATERWTDEMLDRLASKVDEIADSVDSLRITAQALLQVAAQNQRDMELMKERQTETDPRFNVLLEELRYLIQHDRPEPQS